MADELTIADRALLRIEEVPKEAVLPCLFPGCTLDASRSDQMCARHSAFVLSRRTKAALARQMLEENALQYAADHAKASQMGAEKGGAVGTRAFEDRRADSAGGRGAQSRRGRRICAAGAAGAKRHGHRTEVRIV
jgi:hypothetical protein